MRFMSHNWSATKQRLHPQSVAEISRHSVLSGQDSTMWDIVWVSPQGHRSVSVSRHSLLQAPQCACSYQLICCDNERISTVYRHMYSNNATLIERSCLHFAVVVGWSRNPSINTMSGGLDALSLREDDVKKFLVCGTHLGATNLDFQMEQYVYKRKTDGIYIFQSCLPLF